ncbi:hypothetical protein M3Y99_01642200 [Aphelenchoides fujianensis]|nr:hypothetical protein M3Y99_01642200 [Aphelenchoides fujianensis]
MYAFLLLLLVATIAAVPLDVRGGSTALLGSNALSNKNPDILPLAIASDALQIVLRRWRESLPCIKNETAHHANVTEETKHQIEARCYAKAGYANMVLRANVAVFEAVHGKKELDEECLKAFFDLKWKEDPRMNPVLPIKKEDRQKVCSSNSAASNRRVRRVVRS